MLARLCSQKPRLLLCYLASLTTSFPVGILLLLRQQAGGRGGVGWGTGTGWRGGGGGGAWTQRRTVLEVMLFFSPGRMPFKGPLKEAATLSSSVVFGCLQEPLLRLIPICFGELSREKGCRHEVPGNTQTVGLFVMGD